MAGTELDIYDEDGAFSSSKVAKIYEEAKRWTPERKRAAMLYMESAATRERIKRKYRNTAEIAHAVDPDFTITPALTLIADAIETVLAAPRRNLIVTMPPQEGKGVPLSSSILAIRVPHMGSHTDTDVLSLPGFVRMADLTPGDFVFHPDGHAVRVIAKSQTWKDRPLFRVDTSDGRSVVVDDQHLWHTDDLKRDRSVGGKRVRGGWWDNRTTAELYAAGVHRETPRTRASGTIAYSYRWALPAQAALRTHDNSHLPIPPYALGLWLADGGKHNNNVYEGVVDAPELCRHLEASGVSITRTVQITGIKGSAIDIGVALPSLPWVTALKMLGVYGDKHIPDQYLCAGTDQRLELLRGLLDGDGAISTNGRTFRVEFSTALPELALGVAHLVRSLGWRTTIKQSKSSLDGVRKKDRYRVCFTPTTDDPNPFHLTRKAARVQADKSRGGERHRVTITDIVPVGTGDTVCIQVDSPDGLFLAGRDLVPTHNSTLCAVFAPIRAWQLNPNRRIILATYGDDLALAHSSTCRSWIERFGTGVTDPLTGTAVEDKLGLRLSKKSRRMDAWAIDGGKGGMVAAGLGSAITGRAADLFIIDDPYKNMQEADSATHRAKVDEWMASVALTRLSPQASMVLIQTRWHPMDLAGQVLEGEKVLDPEHRTWRHLNIPAISQEGIDDSLGRDPGIAMISARGRSKAEFEQTRRQVGERVWFAMYQGSPRNPEGGLFERRWFDPRVEELPSHPVAAVVAVDPADSGEGDETGILGAILAPNGEIIFVEDWSDQLTSDQWATRAIDMALTIGAREITLEGYSTFNTYRNVVKSAWADTHREAREALALGHELSPVQLRALTPNMPFVIGKYTENGDAEGRSALLRKDFERKRARVVDYKLNIFVDQAADWQTGMHCPDRVAAAVIGHWRLDQMGSGRMQYGHPLQDRAAGPPPERLTRTLGDRSPLAGLPFASRDIVPWRR